MPSPTKTYYEILGISPNSSNQEIKKAYRGLVKKCHPDIDYKKRTKNQRSEAHSNMQVINEAYETLMNKEKRLDYDFKIGVRGRWTKGVHPTVKNTDLEREKYLKKVFNPQRRAVVKVVNEYKKRLSELSQDIYDDLLLEEFGNYVERLEKVLVKASNSYTESPPPESLSAAVQWMRHSLAQASDGLDELNEFMQNFDYDHLSMASNLFKISIEHSKVALNLTKV